MGKIVLAAKITHVPTMLLSERPGKLEGCRQQAIDGHKEIARRAREAGADTVVVIDTHWLVNAGYHVNSGNTSKAASPATSSRTSFRTWNTNTRVTRHLAT
nr:hypothetical protein [Aliamphritea spongicola]